MLKSGIAPFRVDEVLISDAITVVVDAIADIDRRLVSEAGIT
ncbi:MAG: hypothetical protein ACJAYU_001223 [Bradymonadia bacterium]|jgi:hypothetical protein